MIDNDLDDLVETGNDGNAAKTLRKQNAQLAADLKAAQERIDKFEASQRKTALTDLIVKAGGKPGWAKYAAGDIDGDPTEDSVRKWLETEGSDLGWTPSGDDQGDDADGEMQEQARRVSRASSEGVPQTLQGWTPERVRNASWAELEAAGLVSKR